MLALSWYDSWLNIIACEDNDNVTLLENLEQ